MAPPKNKKFYALYRGDNLLFVGTLDEMMVYLNIKDRNFIHIIKSPSWRKKYEFTTRPVLYEIEE